MGWKSLTAETFYNLKVGQRIRGKHGAPSYSGVEGTFEGYIDAYGHKDLLSTSWIKGSGYSNNNIREYLEVWVESIPCREFTELFIHNKKAITGELLVSL